MAEYVLTTDSNSDVPVEFLREYEIPVIPSTICLERRCTGMS